MSRLGEWPKHCVNLLGQKYYVGMMLFHAVVSTHEAFQNSIQLLALSGSDDPGWREGGCQNKTDD